MAEGLQRARSIEPTPAEPSEGSENGATPHVAEARTPQSTAAGAPRPPAARRGRQAAPRPRPAVPAVTHDDPVLASLQRLEGLVATLVRVALRPVLEEQLQDPVARTIYQATGEKTVREIAAMAGVSISTVSERWRRLEELGLIVKDGTRYRRAF